ncbi:MAG: hypothetical protein WEB52_11760 [Dehalococcoidia bacterium]
MNSYVVVFRGDAVTGGFPIAISGDRESVRVALRAGLSEAWAFAQDHVADPVIRARARGSIAAINEALSEVNVVFQGEW